MTNEVELSLAFRDKVESTGMTHSAIARAIGVTRQFFSAVWLGKEQPTIRFAVGAINAGLGNTFDDILTHQVNTHKKSA